MTPVQLIVMERALFSNDVLRRDFIPAHEVKRYRRFPTQYSNRCSELVRDGYLKREGFVDRCQTFSVTAKGRKAYYQHMK